MRRRHPEPSNWALALILWAMTCTGCYSSRPIPLSPRPDTRKIFVIAVDSEAQATTLRYFNAALPNETAVCYTGELRDTTAGDVKGYVLHLTHATPAIIDSTDKFHVWFTGHGAILSCQHAIAVAHSHPYSTGWCEHSEQDARLLFMEKQALVSLVWCGDGQVQAIYQDGRRQVARWKP